MVYSIWSDIYYRKTIEEDSLEYRIVNDDTGTVIYSGRAYKFPDRNEVVININKICQNYLNSNIEPLMQDIADGNDWNSYRIPDAVHRFTLYERNGSIPMESWTFINDWSYDIKQRTNGTYSMNAIINGHYAEGMVCLETAFNGNDAVHVSKSGNGYDVASCGDYALYYQNLYGGWNSFLIEGKANEVSDDITAYNYNKAFNNNTVQFEEGRYIAEIKTKYRLYTGLLDDDESWAFVSHLLGSNTVYMHDLKKDKVYPVIITNKDLVYKTYANQDNEPVQYTIDIQLSQTRVRI